MTAITFSSLSLSTAMITRDEMFSIGRNRLSMMGSYSEWHHTWTGFPIISCCGCTCGHFTTANTCLTDLSWCDADVEGIVNVWLMKYCIWAGRAEVINWLAKGNMGVHMELDSPYHQMQRAGGCHSSWCRKFFVLYFANCQGIKKTCLIFRILYSIDGFEHWNRLRWKYSQCVFDWLWVFIPFFRTSRCRWKGTELLCMLTNNWSTDFS